MIPQISSTPSNTPSNTATITPTSTSCPLFITPTNTPTFTNTPTNTPTFTNTPTNTRTPTMTPTPSSIPASVDYASLSLNNTSATGYTFTGVSILGPGLIVVVSHIEATANRQIASVSINGNAATIAQQITQGTGASFTNTGISYFRVSGGTTANIIVTYNGSVSRCGMSVFRIQNNISDTPIQSQTTALNSGTNLSLTFTSLTANNVGILGQTNGAELASISWSGATSRYNTPIAAPGGNTRVSGADFLTSSSGNRTITTTSSPSSLQPLTLVGVVWN